MIGSGAKSEDQSGDLGGEKTACGKLQILTWSFPYLLVKMNFRLKIEPKGFSDEVSGKACFSFAVVDLDRSKTYPQNFVCMLPMHFGKQGKVDSAFQKVFGEKSVEQAKALLTAALKTEDETAVKVEIERRLKLLEPASDLLVKCSGCGKTFNPGWMRRFRRKFCPECMARKYGSRN